MFKSYKNLFLSPYNKQHRLFALRRFIYWKIIRAGKLKNVRFNLWHDRTILLNHDSFQSMWIMYNYIVDWEEFHLIKYTVKPGDVVFDIGANMGFYTIWLSKFIDDGSIHSFEPDNANFNRLNENARINDLFERVHLNKMAVSDYDGEANFTQGLDGENHIAVKVEPKAVKIPSVKLDSYVGEKKISKIRYCKIDVEGFEFAVLKGARQLLLSKRIDVLQLEINDKIENAGVSIDTLTKFLEEVQYTLCSYDVQEFLLKPVIYSKERENYFAVSDIKKINTEIKKYKASLKI